MFSYGLPVCKQLQKERLDMKKTIGIIENLIQVLTDLRLDAENEFKIIFDEAQVIYITINTISSVPIIL